MNQLRENIYGDSAIVYHRSPLTVSDENVTPEEALQNEPILFAWDHSDPSILNNMEWGFKAGHGDYYGKGFYSVFSPDQINQIEGGNRRYGDILIKFRVLNISNYLFLDFDQFKKTTKYQGNSSKYNEENFIFRQLLNAGVPNAEKLSYNFNPYLRGECTISDLQATISGTLGYFDGLVYTGGHSDGDVLVTYDTDSFSKTGGNVHKGVLKGLWPINFSLDDGMTWTKIPISNQIASLIRQYSLAPGHRSIPDYKTQSHCIEIMLPDQSISDFSEDELQKKKIVLFVRRDQFELNLDLIRPFLKFKPKVQLDNHPHFIITREGGDLSPILNLIKPYFGVTEGYLDTVLECYAPAWFSDELKIKAVIMHINEANISMVPDIYKMGRTYQRVAEYYHFKNNEVRLELSGGSIDLYADNTKGLEHIVIGRPTSAQETLTEVSINLDTDEDLEIDILEMPWIQDLLTRGTRIYCL